MNYCHLCTYLWLLNSHDECVTCRLAISAIKQLHPDVIASIQTGALFSKEEETLLGKVTSVSLELWKHTTLFYSLKK